MYSCRVTVKKNNVQWLDNNTKIHYSVERIFTRLGQYDKSLLDQEGAFVDILRVVNQRLMLVELGSFRCRCFERNSLV